MLHEFEIQFFNFVKKPITATKNITELIPHHCTKQISKYGTFTGLPYDFNQHFNSNGVAKKEREHKRPVEQNSRKISKSY